MGYNTATIRESFRYPGTKTQAQRGRDQNYICSKELIGKVIYVSADYYTGMLSQNGLHGTGQADKFSDNVNLVLASPNKDRKSTRLNSSHSQISYAVFCLK